MNTTELKKLAAAASGWKLDEFRQSEDDKEAGVALVGGKYEDGEFAEVMTIDTGLYYQDDKAIELARFYAAANPAAILKLLAINAELVEALKALLRRDERNTCTHEETYRGGAIWEICRACGARWADDEGGKPEWDDPLEWINSYAALAKAEGGEL